MMESLLAVAERRKDAEKVQRQAARIKREFQESVQGVAKPKAPAPKLPRPFAKKSQSASATCARSTALVRSGSTPTEPST